MPHLPSGPAGPPPAETAPLDFVGVGLVALGTVMTLARPFGPDNDWKADAARFWEPELGTFVSLAADVLRRWGRRVALMTTMGEDAEGERLRALLAERRIELLFARVSPCTGRQIVLTPAGTEIRYIVDRHVERPPLGEEGRAALAVVAERLALRGCRWLAFDKYETDLVEALVSSPAWRQAEARPGLLFETGSRPLAETGSRPLSLTEAQAEGVTPELARVGDTDVFTTTWEWLEALVRVEPAAAAALGRDALGRPDDVHEPGGPLVRLLRALIFKPEAERPVLALITAGSRGCLVVTRRPDGDGLVVERQAVFTNRERATFRTHSRVGAGDVFRAALLGQLLDQGIGPAELPAFVAREGETWVARAQRASFLWLVRQPEEGNYWGAFPTEPSALGAQHLPRRP